jgi:hypothetical protein
VCKRDRLLERVGREGFTEYSDFEISDSRNAFRSMRSLGEFGILLIVAIGG